MLVSGAPMKVRQAHFDLFGGTDIVVFGGINVRISLRIGGSWGTGYRYDSVTVCSSTVHLNSVATCTNKRIVHVVGKNETT